MKKMMFLLALAATGCHATAQENDRGYIVKVGDAAPDVELISLDGTKRRLSAERGKVVMLQFTASWCGVCRQEMPHIERDVWLKHKDNPRFALYGIDLKESREVTERFAAEMKITYPLLLDPEGKAFYSVAARGAGVTRNVIVDKKGNIAFLTRLYDAKEFATMVAVIEKLLQE
ncbi:MAG: TlpA family protein disulfide reductase [Odoribacteraceae bacterium]|jgi:peroxiredoxin|nr:TlpA family protein disulfide reductase [Odoribacteraceae bacterium]